MGIGPKCRDQICIFTLNFKKKKYIYIYIYINFCFPPFKRNVDYHLNNEEFFDKIHNKPFLVIDPLLYSFS